MASSRYIYNTCLLRLRSIWCGPSRGWQRCHGQRLAHPRLRQSWHKDREPASQARFANSISGRGIRTILNDATTPLCIGAQKPQQATRWRNHCATTSSAMGRMAVVF